MGMPPVTPVSPCGQGKPVAHATVTGQPPCTNLQWQGSEVCQLRILATLGNRGVLVLGTLASVYRCTCNTTHHHLGESNV